ncbi:PepSY domain-containing protein [Sphingobacterium sp. E70]|uniref:PepSY domain-containing protein n=1 Tax=Sphingobacterium sp. E70 TaxID=2853439 RepID=UPI00211BC742|nr:PepSY-associated TM helix domain-containing protein [Sphingobacterium sp. E70]
MLSKINAWLHLWLGIAAGIPVIILGITGCVLVFEHDIKELTTNYIQVTAQKSEEQLPHPRSINLLKRRFLIMKLRVPGIMVWTNQLK